MTTLLEACDAPDLFGFPLFDRQRDLLGEIEAGPRIHVWALGRRSGKTTISALAALHSCLLRPDLDALVRRGERRYAVCIGTNQAQSRLLLRAAHSVVEASPLLSPLIEAATEDELRFTLPSGARTALRAFPASSRGARGWPISFLAFDEMAHHLSPEDGGDHAEALWTALVPATAQFGDLARVLCLSTPWGRHGLFATLFDRARSGGLPDARARRLKTSAVNPTIDEAFLEIERRRDPDTFRAEYLAEFLDSGAAFLSSARVRAAALEPRELPPDQVVAPVAAIDAAFARDPFALAIAGRDPHPLKRGRLRLALVRSWAPPPGKGELDVAAVLEAVAAECKRFGVGRVICDQYSSAPVRQHLNRLGLAASERTMTLPSKTAIYTALKAKLYAGDLELRDHPDLIAELERIEVAYSAGTQSIRIPRVGGSHGDLAQACALAVAELARVPGDHGKVIAGGRQITAGIDREITGAHTPREPLPQPVTGDDRFDGDGVLLDDAIRDY